MRNELLLARLRRLARAQHGVLSRRQLYELGATRSLVKAHLRAGRWQRIGDQSVCLYTGPLTDESLRIAAVSQGGPRAHLDGASALVAAGLERFSEDRIRVTIPRGARVRRIRAFNIRQSRRWDPQIVHWEATPPRTHTATAAIRAALWAASARQAELVLTMAVQQRLVTVEQLASAALAIRRDRRRSLIHETILEIGGGAQSLGEIDVAKECRRRGLPEPDRQALRTHESGRHYLDVEWARYGVVLEVDGIHHQWVENVVADALRHNRIAMDGATVLRLPLLGLRHDPDAFFAQIAEALRRHGWRPAA